MDDIAKSAELNRATLYLYFEKKWWLFFAVLLRGAMILNAMVKEMLKPPELILAVCGRLGKHIFPSSKSTRTITGSRIISFPEIHQK